MNYYVQVSFGDKALRAYALHLLNELPDNIKYAHNVQNAKNKLNTLLFQKHFIWRYGQLESVQWLFVMYFWTL